jgi:cytochrome b561
MPKPSLSPSYDNVAKTLHWLIALAIVAVWVIGYTMTHIERDNPYKFPLFQWHKSIGITILLLSFVRLVWRLMNPPPPLPAHMPPWERMAAKASHLLFYVLMIGMPLVGWAIVSSSPLNLPTYLYGHISWFKDIPWLYNGIFWPNLPVLPDLDPDTKKQASHTLDFAHECGAYILAGLLVLHIGAAHKHHWFDRDDVLTRMTPGPISRLLNRLRGTK